MATVSPNFVSVGFAFGYIGESFHGSQIQPKIPTVQGALESALKELNWLEDDSNVDNGLIIASRTDAGVNVRMNVAKLKMPEELWNNIGKTSFVQAMNEHLPLDIVVWNALKTPDSWTPRLANSRTYRYRLDTHRGWKSVADDVLEKWLKIFEGTHNFSNFARIREGINPTRIVYECRPWYDRSESGERIIGFQITGHSFLWNQVRRIAGSIISLSRELFSEEEVVSALNNPNKTVDLTLADPEWLILWSIEFDSVDLLDFDSKNLESKMNTEIAPRPSNHIMHKLWQESAKETNKQYIRKEWIRLLGLIKFGQI